MPLGADIRTAKRMLRGAYRSWRSRNLLAERLAEAEGIAPGTAEIAVYFADSSINLYQLRQWYAPLAELAQKRPVVVIARTPEATVQLLRECPVPVVHLRKVADLERFTTQHPLKMVFYVNQNAKNLTMFRYGRMWHVFVNHGESDKAYMVSNQYKAYDYAFVAGPAARERLDRALWNYDVDARTLEIGRPQADHFAGPVPFPSDDRTVVLYAPTWEGDRASMAYGSIASHGVTLVTQLINDRRFRVIYRPHPRSGVVRDDYRAANEAIIAALDRANRADASAHHVFDTSAQVGWQLVAADVAITDISAMVYDRLATGKPLLVTRPESREAEIDESGYLGACEWVTSDAATAITARVDAVLHDPEAQQRLNTWVHRHFGDTTPGAATARFHAAVDTLVGEWHRHADRAVDADS